MVGGGGLWTAEEKVKQKREIGKSDTLIIQLYPEVA